ncbi:hypothetical protein MPTK1_4g11000 [Marchantia polymorpha subsp. ruderalis]|uniref:Uncharacterized protein n=2 Tax=Marchantia polymorpha TaxID=3197 RepID=A0AAF6B8N3_MARPO|nr:hypothetical protein MARPO_0011s0085 [Marchantia polymorpha]PTQ46404.1 hypothetical protein MARPO_0011s0085 [Marchantia polymorpha]BBN08367.1 hypothetical protein Mp_4g11000 [Marchantia polymorpha subsp. ruderalis]BBN08368.1 hypothetical protein Mp_4g11000 [Marchantia polymorpha subsp. ruderalis]|eukprot:PTQ46403.1 hypothetical protein MARPO_0011s0085 [Marchantia polymorpha]
MPYITDFTLVGKKRPELQRGKHCAHQCKMSTDVLTVGLALSSERNKSRKGETNLGYGKGLGTTSFVLVDCKLQEVQTKFYYFAQLFSPRCNWEPEAISNKGFCRIF